MLLSPDERNKALSKSVGWKDVSDRNAISKTFEFRDIQEAWRFMSDVAKVVEKANHYPECTNTNNHVSVTLTSHDCGGVSQKDINLAQTMDMCAKMILQGQTEAKLLSFQPTCDLYDDYPDSSRVPCASFLNLGGEKQFCGRAVTVKCFEDNSRIKDIAENRPGEGKVLVVDGGASLRCALLGDMVAKKAVENGWEGFIIYANVRDVEELRKLKIGVLALGSTPRKSTRRGEGQVDIPVLIGGVWCKPGDRVYADENGVIILD